MNDLVKSPGGVRGLRVVGAPVVEGASLASRILSAAGKVKKTRRLTLYGFLIEVRQPTVQEHLQNLDAVSGDTSTMSMYLLAKIMLHHCYIPGSEDRLFSEEDVSSFMEAPHTSEASKLIEVYTALTVGGT